RDTDLAGGRVDVGIGQLAPATQVLQDGGKPVGEGVEHGCVLQRSLVTGITAQPQRYQHRGCARPARTRSQRAAARTARSTERRHAASRGLPAVERSAKASTHDAPNVATLAQLTLAPAVRSALATRCSSPMRLAARSSSNAT